MKSSTHRWMGGAICLLTSSRLFGALIGVDWDDGRLYRISTSTALPTLIGNTGVPHLSGLEFSPDGTLYGFTSGASAELYRIDPFTAEAISVGSLDDFVFEGALVFTPEGTAYGASGGSVASATLFTIDSQNGLANPMVTIGAEPHDVNGLAWRSDGMLIALDRRSNALIVIDPSDGSVSTLVALAANVGATGGMTAAGDTGYFVTSGPGDIVPGSSELYRFDLFTGETTRIGTFAPPLTGSGFGGLAIPEPAMLLLIILGGVACLAGGQRGRGHSTTTATLWPPSM